MVIYVSHSKDLDFQKALYQPLKESDLSGQHKFIFLHESSDLPFNSKDLMSSGGCDLVLAEVSYPATGQGVELGWANAFKIPIVCLYKKGSKTSRSLGAVCKQLIEYSGTQDMIHKIRSVVKNYG